MLMNLGVIQLDPWLSPFKDALRSRFSKAQKWLKTIDETEGGMEKFTRGFERFGFTFSDNGDIMYREWAPNAEQAFLIGEFNNWNREATPMKRGPFGVWELFLPANDGVPAIAHNTKVKISMIIPGGERIERVSQRLSSIRCNLVEST
jgi:1,4-alpha-glucan branching enzyme